MQTAAALEEKVLQRMPLEVHPRYLNLFGLFDSNAAHFYDEAAKKAGFIKGRVAHGMLGISLAAAEIADTLDASEHISEIAVNFRKPVYLGSRLIPPYVRENTKNLILEIYSDGQVATDGYAKTGPRHTFFPFFEALSSLPTIDDFTIVKSRHIFGNSGINPQELQPGHRDVVLFDPVRLKDERKENDELYNHLLDGMSQIEPLLYLSGALGKHCPGEGTVYASQEGTFMPQIPGMAQFRIKILVNLRVMGREPRGDWIKYELATNVFEVYNPPCFPILHAYKIFEGTAGVMVRNQQKPTVH